MNLGGNHSHHNLLGGVRPGATVTLDVLFNGQPLDAGACRLHSLSPDGAVLAMSEDIYDAIDGEALDMRLTIGDQMLTYTQREPTHLCQVNGSHLIRLPWESSPAATQVERGPRWQCSSYLSPSCVVSNPYELYGKVCLKVENLSKDGLGLVTDQTVGLLAPGMKLDCTMLFPGLSEEPVKLELRWIKQVSDGPVNVVRLGAKLIKSSPSYLPCVGQYLFQHVREAAVIDIWQAGILIQSVASGVTYDFVRSGDDYREVLELRRATYYWAQVLAQNARPEEMGDEYDAKAKILIARHRGKCIGSLRMIFPVPDDRIEQTEYVTIPDDFPRNEDIVEVTRICIDPDYRKGDLMLGMLKQMMLVMLQTGRYWMTGSTEERLLPYYQSLGAKATNLKYSKIFGSTLTNLTVLLLDIRDFLNQVGVRRAIWELMAPDIISFARRNEIPIQLQAGGVSATEID